MTKGVQAPFTTSRAVNAAILFALDQVTLPEWLTSMAFFAESDQEVEDYAWLGQVPPMREWKGGRQVQTPREYRYELRNLHFETSIKIPVKWMRRDKTRNIQLKIEDLSKRPFHNWHRLAMDLINLNGLAYDGAAYFGSHTVGEAAAQSNVSNCDVATTTAPTAGEFEKAVMQGITNLLAVKDDQNEPCNEGAMNFMVLAPINMLGAMESALNLPVIADSSSSARTALLPNVKFRIEGVANPRLTATSKITVLRTDASAKPFLMQQEQAPEVKSQGEGSHIEFNEDMHEHGVNMWCNAGYGLWEMAHQVTLT